MATLRDIKRRIVGVKNTQKITKAMKMIAAAKLRKAQTKVINARPYADKIASIISRLPSEDDLSSNPFSFKVLMKGLIRAPTCPDSSFV